MSDNQSENSGHWGVPLTSSMPPIEQVKDLYTMKMERIVVEDYPWKQCDTHIDIRVRGSGEVRAVVDLYTVSEPRVQGYLPSKVWMSRTRDLSHVTEMVFYCNPTLPDGARPFGDGPMYCWMMAVSSDMTVEYDVEARVFVDQVVFEGAVWYVFVCGEDQLGKLIVRGEKT